ncbi:MULTISPECIES: ABC transporter permease [Gordonia]|jgi:osmoprotectant transport system permease protein|uniref:Putative ABC transporter permease protein n=1 Tax=Gordonia malaquae NBRC 108250 TaxID=1223542 RepID=M3TAC0_GORML|nr:ABC transporter permease [Gordonia malaquae]GAC78351.1 putative ABC transporter permease protein [Gordonia malaquae NBRC 108250]SED32869.1 osmoprotectant transport system permease protein [Gordonia malaquae]
MTTETKVARSTTIQLWAQPLVVAVLAGGVLTWALSRDLTDTQKATINTSYIAQLIGEHLALTVAITAIVLAVSVPLAVLVTRNRFRWLAPLFVGIANIGQAAPAIGLLVLFFLWTATTGFWIGVLPVAFYSLLPVLRNSILGLNEVDRALIDAARGQGMSEVRILLTVELPLAVPFILAGLRTSLVLAVGTATLCFLVDAGGLGILIDTGYKLRDNVTLVLGAVLAVSLALIVDWCGALAERYLGPKGLR